MPAVAKLMDPAVSRGTVELAETLLEGAKAGLIVGLAVGLFYKGRRYSLEVAGAALNDPTFALGVTEMLQGELRELVHERGQTAATIT